MKLLLYCTKAKPYLLCEPYIDKNKPCRILRKDIDKTIYNCVKENAINGKIIAECDFEVEEIACSKIDYARSYSIDGNGQAFYSNSIEYEPFYLGLNISNVALLKRSCLTNTDLNDYLQGENGYVIYIKNLKIFNKPRELYDCLTHPKIEPKYYGCEHLSKAPQNMMYVELDDIKYILISIRPEWLCKILNGEKTIEVRKKVLKEMLNNA